MVLARHGGERAAGASGCCVEAPGRRDAGGGAGNRCGVGNLWAVSACHLSVIILPLHARRGGDVMTQREGSQLQAREGGLGQILHTQPLEGTNLPTPRPWTCVLQNFSGDTFLWVKLPSGGTWLGQPWDNNAGFLVGGGHCLASPPCPGGSQVRGTGHLQGNRTGTCPWGTGKPGSPSPVLPQPTARPVVTVT